SSRRRHTRFSRDWSSDVCSSDLVVGGLQALAVLEQVDTDQQAAAIRQQAAQVAQEVQCLMRLEVADAGAREESQRTGSPEGLGQDRKSVVEGKREGAGGGRRG